MRRKKEVLKVLDELGIDYNELDSGEVLFRHDGGNYWFHPDDSKPEFVTVNKLDEHDGAATKEKRRLCCAVNEINKSAPGIKAIMMEDDVLLNCDFYPGRHRLCASDFKAMLTKLDTAENVLNRLLDTGSCDLM